MATKSRASQEVPAEGSVIDGHPEPAGPAPRRPRPTNGNRPPARRRVPIRSSRTSARRCRGLSEGGRPCRRNALADADYCAEHHRAYRSPPASRGHGTPRPGPGILSSLTSALTTGLMDLATGLGQIKGHLSTAREIRAELNRVLCRNVPGCELVGHKVQELLSSDYLNPDTWKGILYVVQQSLEALAESRRRRARGDYEIDEYGMDEELFFAIRPITQFLHNNWFRVKSTGIENVPVSGRALLVCNHSGVLPFDAAMITEALWTHHPEPRFIRWLFLKWFVSLPFFSPYLNRLGGVLACPENGARLLEEDRLVGVFPEGIKGIGKRFKDRYKLARFGRGGFIKMVLKTRSPVIPVSVVGAEEIYPALFFADFISRPLGIPYIPITPTFPWLGPLGFIPLPSRWHITFGKPLRFKEGAEAKANDFLVVSLLSERVRGTIQSQIDASLRERPSIF